MRSFRGKKHPIGKKDIQLLYRKNLSTLQRKYRHIGLFSDSNSITTSTPETVPKNSRIRLTSRGRPTISSDHRTITTHPIHKSMQHSARPVRSHRTRTRHLLCFPGHALAEAKARALKASLAEAFICLRVSEGPVQRGGRLLSLASLLAGAAASLSVADGGHSAGEGKKKKHLPSGIRLRRAAFSQPDWPGCGLTCNRKKRGSREYLVWLGGFRGALWVGFDFWFFRVVSELTGWLCCFFFYGKSLSFARVAGKTQVSNALEIILQIRYIGRLDEEKFKPLTMYSTDQIS